MLKGLARDFLRIKLAPFDESPTLLRRNLHHFKVISEYVLLLTYENYTLYSLKRVTSINYMVKYFDEEDRYEFT